MPAQGEAGHTLGVAAKVPLRGGPLGLEGHRPPELGSRGTERVRVCCAWLESRSSGTLAAGMEGGAAPGCFVRSFQRCLVWPCWGKGQGWGKGGSPERQPGLPPPFSDSVRAWSRQYSPSHRQGNQEIRPGDQLPCSLRPFLQRQPCLRTSRNPILQVLALPLQIEALALPFSETA